MSCSETNYCSNPNIINTDDNLFCLNCYASFKKDKNTKTVQVDNYQCCDNPNIIYQDDFDYCVNCGTIHQKFVQTSIYLENDKFITNVLHQNKKIHLPYKYLQKIYPQIKSSVIYNFIMESIDEIKKFYNLKERAFKTYVPYLYNYYQMKNKNIPIIDDFKKEKDLFLEELLKKINEIHSKYFDSVDNEIETTIKELVIDDKPSNKYYCFNKTKNKYLKKYKYCQFEDCLKIGNFKFDNNLRYCKKHAEKSININNKKVSMKCDYNNCKKNTIDKYCQNHKYKCVDNECDIRIMKDNSYCKIHR